MLVTGAAGGVGQYAVQLAKWGGATVLATASSVEKAEQARTVGADHVINYREVVYGLLRIDGITFQVGQFR